VEKGRITHYDAELNSAVNASWRLKIRSEAVWSAMSLRSGTSRLLTPAAENEQRRSAGSLAASPGRATWPGYLHHHCETSGLIYKLGQFVLQRACQDLQPFGEFKLSVNISPAQFRDPEFEDKVARCWRPPVPGNRLQQVTRPMCWKTRSVPMAIANLKALGTAVALDDFGTGYSSIGYLRRLTSTPSRLINRWPGWWITMNRRPRW
jgi:hypothetical protein